MRGSVALVGSAMVSLAATDEDIVAGARDSRIGTRASELGDDVGVAACEKSSAAAVLAVIMSAGLRLSAGVMRWSAFLP